MASSSQLRAWYPRCARKLHKTAFILIGERPVHRDTVEAWDAFSKVLLAKGYDAQSVGTYNCRRIGGSSAWSLHAYAIAVDIDPYALGNGFSPGGLNWAKTEFTKEQVDAVYNIKTNSGKRVFKWGGYWKTKQDYMHWQIDVPAGDLRTGINWGSLDVSPPTTPPPTTEGDDMALLPVQYGHGYNKPPADSGLSGNQKYKQEDVRHVQLLAEMSDADADGVYGKGTAADISESLGLDEPVMTVTADLYGALMANAYGGQATYGLEVERVSVIKDVKVKS